MRKFLALLTVVGVIVLTFVGALSVVPHAHGHDLDHSTHKSCPVYQFCFHGFDAWVGLFGGIVVLFSVGFVWLQKKDVPLSFFTCTASSRAPPALS